ncbi:hypothetical protein L1987_61736 [Smallanthus sonchifolius]|uniref:Uncharacterized protein n=1 Tax=Smallanthus sonchifolius TaxID=185202 RepID=A0ACB9C8M3_9ASTR|nr:hypothetical protein L1987_61736 [Smallanthus sonchifolius]
MGPSKACLELDPYELLNPSFDLFLAIPKKKEKEKETPFALSRIVATTPPCTIVILLRRTSTFGGVGESSVNIILPEGATSFSRGILDESR